MKILIRGHETRKDKGFALPVVLFFLLVFSIIGLSFVNRFSGTGSKEATQIQSNNQKYGGAFAGLERAKYELIKPANYPNSAHIWGQVPDYKETFTMTMESGEKVTVTMEDISLPQ